jgi:hypothetical protein
MQRRLKAAIKAAPFCQPQLKATAVIIGSDFANEIGTCRQAIGGCKAD